MKLFKPNSIERKFGLLFQIRVVKLENSLWLLDHYWEIAKKIN